MRVNTRIVLLIETGQVLSRESYDYHGPVVEAITFGTTGNKSSSQSKQQSQSKSESGTEFNEDFLNKAFAYASLAKPGKYKLNTAGTPGSPTAPTQGPFDAARYLEENPDLASNKYFAANPYEHYQRYGKAEGRKYPGDTSTGVPSFAGQEGQDVEFEIPGYDPTYQRGAFTGAEYTPGTYTPVEGGDFNKLESNIYGGNQSKLKQAYDEQVARQREELSQSGALNSPTQFLEGSARSAIDKGFLQNLQQAARDASSMVLGLKQQEAARRTGFDVGEAAARTGFGERQAGRRTEFDTSEAGRETTFSQDVQEKLLSLWLKKIGIIGEVGRYARGDSVSSGSSSSSGGGGGANFGFLGG